MATTKLTKVAEKARESRLRRRAYRLGLRIEKSCRRNPDAWEYGTYHVVSNKTGFLVFANWAMQRGFGLSLDDVEEYLDWHEYGREGESFEAYVARVANQQEAAR